ncbi:MAG TPA: hypothetical protein VEG38_17695, partial [Acidimicrobiia bacterium]|nr:hypothetical protein [Acidimicrobiia bacterium]
MTLGVPVPVPAFADQDRAGILHRVAVARHRNEELRHRVRIASATCAELLDGLRQRRARLRDEARVLRELLPHAREQRRPVARPSHRRSASRGRTDWPAGVGDIHVEYASTRDPCLEEDLVGVYDSFALSVARRFGNRHERAEDLAQVARLGLLK